MDSGVAAYRLTFALRYTLKFAKLAVSRLKLGRRVRNNPMSRIVAILPAAGLGTRMGADTPKQFLELDGVPIVIWSLRRIASCDLISEIIIATRADVVARLEERVAKETFKQKVRVLRGGDSR